MDVPVVVRGELVVPIEALSEQALNLIKSALTFENEERIVAQREGVFGWWDMPEVVILWKIEERRSGTVLVLPRGFAAGLGKGLQSLGYTIAWDDQRVAPQAPDGYYRPFLLRDYQAEAIAALLKAQQGFYKCPAGGGKTVTVLGMAAISGLTTLVIVDKANLLDQWREEAEEFLGLCIDDDGDFFPCSGKVGQGVFNVQPFTIALRQTLHERITEYDATQWWQRWGLTVYDEGHHLAASGLGEISRRCISKVAVGVSATPAKSETKSKIVHALVGPIVHETPRDLLRSKGILMRPSVEQIPTEFAAPFWITHDAHFDKEEGRWVCQVPGCKKKDQHSHRNNYSSWLKKLVENEDRNKQIAAEIVADRGHIHLVPSRQLKHLEALHRACVAAGWDGPTFFIRGEENARGESQEIVRKIRESHEAIIFSTVADEAMNVPPIDRVQIVFPMRQDAAVEQLVGRGERTCEGKTECVVKDWVDVLNDVAMGQAEARELVYRRQGYPITRSHRREKSDGT
jgi:superfamily II DNA or RNA helicase